MKVLHICNNFFSSSVHKNLIDSLQKNGVVNEIIVPIKKSQKKIINKYSNLKKIYIFEYFDLLRYFQFTKQLYLYLKLTKIIKNHKFNTILCHSLWTDGFLGLLACKLFDSSYSIVVRNTDMNIFLRLPYPYRFFINKILSNAKNIIFVSKAHFERFKSFKYYDLENRKKMTCIPNGIDKFWHDNANTDQMKKKNEILFVGRFDRNKNLKNSLKAFNEFNKDKNYSINFVGGGLSDFRKYSNSYGSKNIKIHEKVTNNELIEFYKNAKIFIMPSFTETFGLVYAEALSQGCKIIHTKAEGIDGFFSDRVAFSCNPKEINSIVEALRTAEISSTNKNDWEEVNRKLSQLDWNKIAKNYIEIL